MEQICHQCSAGFVISPEDLAFYDKVSPVFNGKKELIPPPTFCPDCRMQRRLAWRNERNLYHRTCAATGKKIISNYSADKPFPVYETEYWFGDKWDTRHYGRDFDFGKTFLENFTMLQREVPRFMIQQQSTMENSAYCNFASNCKDCYLLFDSDFCRDSLYGNVLKHCVDCIDCSFLTKCELCYECIDCKNSYDLRYSRDCDNCSNSLFLKSCIGCKDCAFSVNLRNAQYVFGNRQLSKQEYERAVADLSIHSFAQLTKYRDEFTGYCSKQIHKYLQGNNNENVSGDHIYHSKNIRKSFNIDDCWDVAFCEILFQARNCMDVSSFGENIEWMYECTTAGLGSQSCGFCFTPVVNSSQLLYCDTAYASKNCFGCVGLHRNEYCIFNKQYTKEQYEALVPTIIDHMRKTGEWGQYFPHAASPFAYNETVAMDFFPLTRDQTAARGWQWKEEELQSQNYMGPDAVIPDTIGEVDDAITDKVLTCSETGKKYKITPKEMSFHKKQNIPLPRMCPDERHRKRMALKSQRMLYTRLCNHCGATLETTFAPDRPEIVCCEHCYLSAIS